MGLIFHLIHRIDMAGVAQYAIPCLQPYLSFNFLPFGSSSPLEPPPHCPEDPPSVSGTLGSHLVFSLFFSLKATSCLGLSYTPRISPPASFLLVATK